MHVLTAHRRPGNVRELQNFIERSVILTPRSTLRPPLEKLRQAVRIASPEQRVTLEPAERDHICRTPNQTKGVDAGPNGAAARLGTKRSALYFRIRKPGISRANKNFHSM